MNNIDYRECRFVSHIPKGETDNDLHLIKEALHLKDGSVIPNVRLVNNYKRKYWITQKRFQNHKQKKEYEYLDRLTQYESTQSDVWKDIAVNLNQIRNVNRKDILRQSPYLYGMDIPSTIQIKEVYKEKMKGKSISPFTVCYSDTETDMLDRYDNKGSIIMQSVFFNGILYSVILKDFVKTIPEVKKTLHELKDMYLPQSGKDLVKEWKVEFVNNSSEIVGRILDFCHHYKPDFVSFWNMAFDMDKMIEALENDGINIADKFCDPMVPKEQRYCVFKKDNPSKTTASGRLITKQPSEQWHSLHCPSSFYFVDQMSTYRAIRKSKQLDKSYSLDFILKKELDGLGKLKHKESEHLSGAQFHINMQQKHPGEYIIYHIWDVLCMQVLNNKTKDLDYTLPSVVDISDFSFYNSEPKRYVHKFHYYILSNHKAVTGTTAENIRHEFDELVISNKGHIVTLEPHLTIDSGNCIFEDYPDLKTNYYYHAADLDVASSYPYGQYVFNISRYTTKKELIEIEGIKEEVRRIQGLNLTGGRTNAVEISTELFGLPLLSDIGKLYDKSKLE